MAKAPAKGGHGHGHDHGPAHGHDDHGGGGGHDDHGGGGHCPPPWIITFADMATLLMAFFVIMLMTAQTDVPKFNAFAAVMRQTFGRVPLDPSDADKGGTSVLDLHFGPQSGEQTNDPPGSRPQSGDPARPDDGEGQDQTKGAQPDGVDEAADALAKAMRDAVAQGELTVESDSGKVVVRLPSGTGPEAAQKIADAIAEAASGAGADATGDAPSGTAPGATGEGQGAAGQTKGTGSDGTGGTDPATDPATGTGTDGATEGAAPSGAADGTGQGAAAAKGEGTPAGSGAGLIRAKLAALEAGLLLESEMAQGSVDIEQRDGSVVVTIGAGGAFTSGSADITPEAQAIIADLEQVSGKATRIVITGHTDNVPLTGGEFKDNWGLAAARAATVLREITDSGLVADAELVAQSKGETEPIADNSTPEGREKNRRIEIEIEFDEETTQ